MDLKVGIITISDRASQGLYDDLGGPALKEAAQGYGWEVVADALVADEKRDIQRAVLEQLRQGAQLVLTTGGTVAVRDITPKDAGNCPRELRVLEKCANGVHENHSQ